MSIFPVDGLATYVARLTAVTVMRDLDKEIPVFHEEIMMTSSNGNILRVTGPLLLALCAGNSPVNGEFPTQRPVTRSFGVFFDLRLNRRLSKQSWGWLSETPSYPLWRHCNVFQRKHCIKLGKDQTKLNIPTYILSLNVVKHPIHSSNHFESITTTSHELHCVSNNRQLHCLIDSLSSLTSKKYQHRHYWPFLFVGSDY